jgi:hypothetical protein
MAPAPLSAVQFCVLARATPTPTPPHKGEGKRKRRENPTMQAHQMPQPNNATARVQPAEPRFTLCGKQATMKP